MSPGPVNFSKFPDWPSEAKILTRADVLRIGRLMECHALGSLDPTMADPQQVRAALLANERAWPLRRRPA